MIGTSGQEAPGELLTLLRRLIRHELDGRPQSALAVVDAVRHKSADSDPGNYDCSVHLHGRDEARYHHVPICTGHRGSVATPCVGDTVLLQFVGGDPQRPVIVGRLHDDQLRAPDHGPEELRTRLPADAAEDERIDLRAAAADGRTVEVLLGEDIAVRCTDDRIELRHGARRCILDGEAGSTTLAADGASLVLEDGGNVELSADGDLTIAVKGSIAAEAQAQLDLNASGPATLKGATVDIN